MLISGGRIVVAAVGAVVLVVVAVFAFRAILSNPTSHETSVTSTPASTTTGSETPNAGNDSRNGPGSNTVGGKPSGENSRANGTTGATTPYTATSQQIQRILGTVAVDVELPHVEGGKPDVAKTFNDGMESALQAQIDSLSQGTLESRPGSGVRIGERVLSGVLRTSSTENKTATSVALASTVVVDTQSGSLVTLSSLFKDQNAGLTRLKEESQRLGQTTSVGSSFDGSRVEAKENTFSRWTAEKEGMRVYFEQGLVAPESNGVVDLTIPWASLNDVMKPGVAQIVAS